MTTYFKTKDKPKIDDIVQNDRLGRCIVIAIHDFGTMDVQSIITGNCYRITGLGF